MTGFASPNHTQTPNDLFDVLLAQIDSLAELKVTLAVVRKTLGYHKKKDPISFRQLQKLTGMQSQAVQGGVDKAIERGTIEIVGHGARGVNIYALVIVDRVEDQYSDRVEDQYTSVLKIKATKETTQKKLKTISPSGDAQSDAKPKAKAERPRNPIFDAVALGSFGLRDVNGDKTIGAMVGKIVKLLKDQPDLTAERIAQFYSWYARETKNADAPRDASKFWSWWLKFVASSSGTGEDDPFAFMDTEEIIGGKPWEAQS